MTTPDVRPVPRNEWSPVPRPGCVGVEGRVLVATPAVTVAMLRFTPQATIDEHHAAGLINVVCMEGEGFTSVAGAVAPIRAGEAVAWPPGAPHRLWTEDRPMVTLMVELP